MDFDSSMINQGNALSTLVIEAARGVRTQLLNLNLPNVKVGITIKIGKQLNIKFEEMILNMNLKKKNNFVY